MIELAKFHPEELNEAIEGLDGLRDIIAPVLRRINGDGMGEQDVQQFIRCLTLAKHALIAMGDFLEGKMAPEPLSGPLTPEQLRGMDGEAVYLNLGGVGEWVLVQLKVNGIFFLHRNGISAPAKIAFKCGGKVYCGKPEEVPA